MQYICEHSFSQIYLFAGVDLHYFSAYLDQKEGHSICLQGPGELHILHFCLNLCHLSTVFMFLDKQHQLHLPLLRCNTVCYILHYMMWCFVFSQFMAQQRTNYCYSHGLPTVSNTLFSLNATLEHRNAHTWNIFFSDPLCLMYSLGRNSFRLWR